MGLADSLTATQGSPEFKFRFRSEAVLIEGSLVFPPKVPTGEGHHTLLSPLFS